MPDGNVAKTSIDALIELINLKGKIELNEAAVDLGVAPDIIENWIKILNENKLVSISYELGKMYVQSILLSKEEIEEAKTKVETKISTSESDLQLELLSLEKFASTIDNLKVYAQTAENLYKQEMPNLQKHLSEINKVYGVLEKNEDKIEAIKKNAETSYDKINSQISEIQNKIDYFEKEESVKLFNEKIEEIKQIMDKVEEVKSSIDLLARVKKEQFANIKKTTDEQLTSIAAEIGKTDKDLTDALNFLHESLKKKAMEIQKDYAESKEAVRKMEEINKGKAQSQKSLSEIKINFNKEYVKIESDISKSTEQLAAKVKVTREEISRLNTETGGIIDINSKILDSNKTLNGISKTVEDTKTQIKALLDEIRALKKYSVSIEKQDIIANRISAKIDQTKKVKKDMQDKIKDATGMLTSISAGAAEIEKDGISKGKAAGEGSDGQNKAEKK
ncbi:MAG: hypothetical protein M1331_03100 [Candidatus Marsarchaeota archaeon]|nr:hypothetical protein [Candidatus Marsarchaeota archaeon]